MRVLLVDDDRADAGLLVEALALAAPTLDVEVARTAADAVARLRRGPQVHLVLLDLNMPGEDGFDLLHRIRGDPTLTGLPVVVLTTSAAARDVQQAYALHANAFLTKPPDLLSTVASMERMCDFWFGLALLPEMP